MTVGWKNQDRIPAALPQMQAVGDPAQTLIPAMLVDATLEQPKSDGVPRPKITSKIDPYYTEQAFEAKLQGEVVLSLVIDRSGCPRNITVVTPLGLGLDENAVGAIAAWRWEPATKAGDPVPVPATINVSFRLM
jgi:TonB family protein